MYTIAAATSTACDYHNIIVLYLCNGKGMYAVNASMTKEKRKICEHIRYI